MARTQRWARPGRAGGAGSVTGGAAESSTPGEYPTYPADRRMGPLARDPAGALPGARRPRRRTAGESGRVWPGSAGRPRSLSPADCGRGVQPGTSGAPRRLGDPENQSTADRRSAMIGVMFRYAFLLAASAAADARRAAGFLVLPAAVDGARS
ncbi:hypothetical protein Sm713_46730 [Streptomyces sp. TS71-3]|nr:hypothetical protein Sm713_46730 [Streptomyces sp. TS71-3]